MASEVLSCSRWVPWGLSGQEGFPKWVLGGWLVSGVTQSPIQNLPSAQKPTQANLQMPMAELGSAGIALATLAGI